MTVTQGIFGDASNFESRFVPDFGRLAEMCASVRKVGVDVVLTSGSFDMVHEGHALYLEAAKGLGGLLVVGVDSDQKIRERKGPERPIVPEQERLRMLTHFRGVDIVTLKPPGSERWSIIKAVRPDVLVATIDTYTPNEIAELESNYCGRVVVLDRQATTTTTARLRLLQMNLAGKLSESLIRALTDGIPPLVQQTIDGEMKSAERPPGVRASAVTSGGGVVS